MDPPFPYLLETSVPASTSSETSRHLTSSVRMMITTEDWITFKLRIETYCASVRQSTVKITEHWVSLGDHARERQQRWISGQG